MPDVPTNPPPAPQPARPGRPGRPRRVPPAWRFTVAGLAAGALLWLDHRIFVGTEAGQRIENLALLGAELRTAGVREDSLASLSGVSIVSFGLALLVIFGIALFTGRPWLGITVAAAMGVSVALGEVLQGILPRPQLVEGPAWLLRNSFPSGHATVAAAIGVGAMAVSPGRLRWLIAPLGAGYAAVIGQANLVAGWHRMSGTIGGVLLVMAVMLLALALLAARGRVDPSPDGRVNRRVRWVFVGAGAVALGVGMLIAALPTVFPLLVAPQGSSNAFMHTALEAAAIGATILEFAGFLAVIEPYALDRGPDARPGTDMAHPRAS
jgi:membrane-associated phospholipid phosphatase